MEEGYSARALDMYAQVEANGLTRLSHAAHGGTLLQRAPRAKAQRLLRPWPLANCCTIGREFCRCIIPLNNAEECSHKYRGPQKDVLHCIQNNPTYVAILNRGAR